MMPGVRSGCSAICVLCGSLFWFASQQALCRLVRGARCRQLLLRGAKLSRSWLIGRVGARSCSNLLVCACLLLVSTYASYALPLATSPSTVTSAEPCRTNRLRLYEQGGGVSKEVSEVSEVRRCHVVDLRPLELLFLRHRAEAVEIDLRGNRVEGEKLRREMTRGTTMTTIM